MTDAQDIPETTEGTVPVDTNTAAPPAWLRHDLLVVAVAAALFFAGALAYGVLLEPTMGRFSQDGLSFAKPQIFLPPQPVTVEESTFGGLGGLAPEGADQPAQDTDEFHKIWRRVGFPMMALEVRIAPKPQFRGLDLVLQTSRRARYGKYLWDADTGTREMGGVEWERAEFHYATAAAEDDAPRVAVGIEYATVNGDRMYVVTVHGTAEEARRLEEVVLSTLTIEK